MHLNLKFGIKKKKLIKLLGRNLYNKSKEYIKESKVIDSYRDYEPSFIFFISGPAGKGVKRFRVNINIIHNSSSTDSFTFRCSCFSENFCEHTGAVLIKHFEILDNSDMEFKEEKPDIVIPFKPENSTNNYLIMNLQSELEKEENEKAVRIISGNKKYCLVFRIFEDKFGENWNIKPGIGQLKKDNSIGQIQFFNSKKLTEPISANEKRLIESLLSKNGYSDNFFNYFNFIKSIPDLKLFSLKNRKNIPLNLHYFNNAVIRFQFSGLNGRETPYFSPIIDFCYKTDTKYTLSPDCKVFTSGLLFCLIDAEKGAILYNDQDNNFTGLLKRIITSENEYKSGDIKNLKAIISRKGIKNIKVNFTQKRLRIIHSIPIPLIEIKEYSEGITINLMFNYNGRIFPIERDEQLLRMDGNKDEYLAAERNIKYEKNRYYFLRALFEGKIIRSIEDFGYSSYRAINFTFSLSCMLNEFILSFGIKLLENGFEIRKKGESQSIKSNAKIMFTVSRNMDWLDIRAEAMDSENKSHEIILDDGFLDNLFVRTENNYYLINKEDVERLQKLKARGMNSDGTLRVSRHNYSVVDELYEQIVNKDEGLEQTKKLINNLKKFKKIEDIKLPSGFNTELREYQKAGLNWLYFLFSHKINGCLADDMGLGKTVQTLALLHKLKSEKKLKNALIVVPVSTIGNWKDEISRFTPGLNALSYHGQNRKTYIEGLKKSDIIIISYSTLRNDIEIFKSFSFTYLILDEAQTIKNAATKIFKCIKLINSEHRLSLSGTPVENNTLELWAQMDFLMPGLLGSLKDFKKQYTRPIEEFSDELKTEILRKTIFPFILRRKKEDVAKDLPEKEEIIQYVEMEKEQRDVYNEIKKYYKNKVKKTLAEKGMKKSAIDILSALLKLRQTAIFPFLANEEYESIPSCKFEIFKNIIEDIIAEGHKVLVFSQFVKSLKRIEDYFKDMNLKYLYLDGSTKKRKEIIKTFQDDEDIRVFLISLKAGGLGINLTAADYVILFDPWWNPALEKQAVDRSHRIGQTKKVIAYKLIVKGTVEEKILILQEKKKKLIDEIVTGEKTIFKSLTKNDIMGLFS